MTSPSSHRHPSPGVRTHLVPLEGGPWLTAGPNRVGPWLLLGGLAWALVSLALGNILGGGMILLAFVGLGASGIGALSCLCIPLGRRWAQVCPECLRSMDRGATTCPHCHFHPPQGVV
jgi:hypothetical protein